jgi:hypothetical protein
VTKFVGTPLRGIEFASPSDEAVSARVYGDTQPRIRIDAGGRITWSSGSISGDTKLYRSDSDTLLTEGIFSASGGVITLATSGSPTVSLPDGAIAVDTTNNTFYFRSNATWNKITVDGATLTVADSPPSEELTSGDLWYESDTGRTFVYYDSYWVEMGSSGNSTTAENITGNAATATKLATARALSLSGDVSGSVSFDGSANVTINTTIAPNSVTLGTDTSGDYVSSLVAGTGITLTNNSGESATPTIAIGQSVATSASVQFASIEGNAKAGTTSTSSEAIGYIGLPQIKANMYM